MACGKNFKIYLVGGFSAIGGFLFGYHTGVISGILTMQDFKETMNITKENSNTTDNAGTQDARTSSIVGVLLFGCFLGSLISGQTSDRFSRKYSIAAFSLIFTISAALQTASPGIIMLLIGRLFAGISIGALSMIVPVYHSEIAATRVRGRIITLQQWAITIGIAISFWINYATHKTIQNTSSEWRIPLGLQMVPSLILSIGILFCPFSPRWLISHDREDEARDVLLKIRSASHDEIEEEMDRIKNEVAYLRENEVDSYSQLLRSPLLRPFLLGVGIQILQQLTGINATMYYAPEIFNKTFSNTTNDTLDAALLATGVNGCVNVLATIPTLLFIDKLGRRILLIMGAAIMSVSMLIVGILDAIYHDKERSLLISWTIIVFIYIFVAGFAFSWGPVAWIYCTEIFPLTMRAKATSLTTAANWATNCGISFAILPLLRSIHYGTFLMFSSFCAAMIGLVYFFYPETKNIHLEEIDMVGVTASQRSEGRRTNYNTFPEQPVVDSADVPFTTEQNLSNQINNSNPVVERDDHLCQKNFDSSETVD